MLPLSYSLRVLWLRRASTLATIGSVVLVVLVLAVSQMLANGLTHTLGISGSDDKALVLQLGATSEEASRMPQLVLQRVAGAPGVRVGPDGQPQIVGESITAVMLPRTDDPSKIASVFVRGVTPASIALRTNVHLVAGRAPQPGSDEAMLGVRMAGRYDGLDLGDGFDLQVGREIRIVGVFEAGGGAHESEVWADLDALRSSLSYEGYLSSITVQLDSARSFSTFANELKLVTNGEALVERESDYYHRISKGLSGLFIGLGGLIGGVFSIGAMLGAAITMYSSVDQRTREIGVFRALGFRRENILEVILTEAIALSVVGASIGIALALAVSTVELSTMNGATGGEITFNFLPSLGIVIDSFIKGALVGLVGGVLPAIRASRVSPLRAMEA